MWICGGLNYHFCPAFHIKLWMNIYWQGQGQGHGQCDLIKKIILCKCCIWLFFFNIADTLMVIPLTPEELPIILQNLITQVFFPRFCIKYFPKEFNSDFTINKCYLFIVLIFDIIFIKDFTILNISISILCQ